MHQAIWILALVGPLIFSAPLNAAPEHVLRYTTPAQRWVEALPVGNGRLGAMVFGGIATERLALNEATLWSGGPKDWNNPGARAVLPKVRAAIFAGRYKEAEELCKQMQGPYTQSFLPLGDLKIDFDVGGDAVTDYERTLDLDRAVTTTRFKLGDATLTREVFASFPDQVIVVRLTSDRARRISFSAALSSRIRHDPPAEAGGALVLRGKAPSHVDPNYFRSGSPPIRYDEGPLAEGMTFDLRVRAIATGGTVKIENGVLRVADSDAVTLLLSAATSFNGFDKSPAREGRDPAEISFRHLSHAAPQTATDLFARHLADYQKLYRRVALELGEAPDAAALTTDARLIRFLKGEPDPGLSTLLFNFGRYLMIAGSRPGGEPLNLQGLWNESMRPPWSSNYTININTQMNYWPAEVANLAECHSPLFAFIRELAVNGGKTAMTNYGARGWVSHHNSDLWRQSAPVGDYGKGDPMWANFATSAPWLCQHLWEHYAFGRDKDFLRNVAWPVMKGAAEFCLDWLVEDPATGHLVTAPSASPEIGFITPDGTRGVVTKGTAMDMQIIWDHFTNTIAAGRELAIEPEFIAQLEAARGRLYPHKIGQRGNLQEWAEDFTETDIHHRHVSHLFGVFPGKQLTPATPELFAAARRALEIRGDGGTGWSLGWKIAFWARFRDGDHAHVLVKNLLRPIGVKVDGIEVKGGGVYPNLFDAHPPFQIDGNFAFTAGVCEMLLQSHLGELHLLPALPGAWPNGSVKGLRARGGYEVDLEWSDGRLAHARITSKSGEPVRIRTGNHAAEFSIPRGDTLTFDGNLRALP